jgi:hypothetical protein
MSPLHNRSFRLASRPVGRAIREALAWAEEPLAEVGPGEVHARVRFLSIEPASLVWMSESDQGLPPVRPGEVVRGTGLAEVVRSRSALYAPGDLIAGLVGWQEQMVFSADDPLAPAPLPAGLGVPLPTLLGALGMPGLTAYFGLTEVGQPGRGETLVVSGAAGATGSVAAQIGQILGARVVGVAGSAEACRWLVDDLGLAAAINPREAGWREQLARATPDGVDVLFESAGGGGMAEVIGRLNPRARVVLSGLAAGLPGGAPALVDLAPILARRVRVEGLLALDFLPRFPAALGQLLGWVHEGKLAPRETIVRGLSRAPEALAWLLDGEAVGPLVIEVGG